MPQRFSRRPQRFVVAALCASLLLGACSSASELAPASSRWPTPAPEPEPPRVAPPIWPSNAVVRTQPNFEAPSATHCARPVQTAEIGTTPSNTQRRRSGSSARDDVAVDAPSPMPSTPLRAEARAARPGEPMPPTPPASPMASAAAETSRAAGKAALDESDSPRFAPPAGGTQPALSQRSRPPQEVVTAGMVDDNADFASYLQFRQRTQVVHREREIAERYLLQVRDARGAAVPDAEVAVQSAGGAAMWARTDTAGRAWLHPDAFDPAASRVYEIAVRKNGLQGTGYLRRGQKSAVDLVLDANDRQAQRARLDLVFLIDATGSMADEIGKLKRTLRSIADEVSRLPSRPDTCFGLVAYRDRGDAFMVRRHDFTNDLGGFQSVLDALQAAGGGDYPEAMNEALHETVHRMSWRGTGATRLVVLLADAPPHLDYGGPQYDDDMMAALGKGIKVFSVGASGLDKQGEYIQRQIAQYTGGRFVFLTYRDAADPASGPGRETVHDVANYSVQTLDKLIVRLVTEELAKLPKAG